MHFSTCKADFLPFLNHVKQGVDKRGAIEILKAVKVEAFTDDKKVRLIGTDLDLVVSVDVLNVSVLEDGVVAVAGHLLYDVFKRLPDDVEVNVKIVEVSGGNKKLSITCASRHIDFSLSLMDVSAFPVKDSDSGEYLNSFKIKVDDVFRMIDSTKFAISNEETRYYLNGVYLYHFLKEEIDVLRAVATDGHRLAEVEIPIPDEGAIDMPGIIIPKNAIYLLQKIIEEVDDEGEAIVSVSTSKIKVEYANIMMSSKLIDGNYPDYEKVIPLSNDLDIIISRLKLIEAIERIATVSSVKTKIISFQMLKNNLLLSASTIDSGDAKEELDVDCDGEGTIVFFNYKFLLELLASLKDDKVLMRFMKGDRPSPVLVLSPMDSTLRFVIMPVSKDA